MQTKQAELSPEEAAIGEAGAAYKGESATGRLGAPQTGSLNRDKIRNEEEAVASCGIISFSTMSDAEQLKKIADDLYFAFKYDEVASQLESHKDGDDTELLWRLARANYERHKSLAPASARLEMLQSTLAVVQRIVELEPQNPYGHKWMAIYMNAIAKLQGSRAQVEQAQTIRTHMEKACELGPEDPTNWHLIGMWRFSVADISWVMRKMAAVIYGEVPPSSFPEACQDFLKAESISTDTWPIKSRNLLMIGKCYQKTKENENAVKYLKMVRDRPAVTTDDKEANEEALTLLKQLGVRD